MHLTDPETTLRTFFQRVLNERCLDLLDTLLAPDYVDHDAPPGAPAGPGPVKAYLEGFLNDYPNLRVTVEDMLVSGNKAAARLVWLGRPRGGNASTHPGVSASTHPEGDDGIHMEGIIIVRFNERWQMAERWSAYKHL